MKFYSHKATCPLKDRSAPETIISMLISYAPRQNKKFKKMQKKKSSLEKKREKDLGGRMKLARIFKELNI